MRSSEVASKIPSVICFFIVKVRLCSRVFPRRRTAFDTYIPIQQMRYFCLFICDFMPVFGLCFYLFPNVCVRDRSEARRNGVRESVYRTFFPMKFNQRQKIFITSYKLNKKNWNLAQFLIFLHFRNLNIFSIFLCINKTKLTASLYLHIVFIQAKCLPFIQIRQNKKKRNDQKKTNEKTICTEWNVESQFPSSIAKREMLLICRLFVEIDQNSFRNSIRWIEPFSSASKCQPVFGRE